MIRVLLSVLLLWVVEGCAEESLTTINSHVSSSLFQTGALKITKDSLDALLRDYPDARLIVVSVPTLCEQQMEAAMRAMEPYSPIEDQWETVKKECWK